MSAVPITRYLVQFDRRERADQPGHHPGEPAAPPHPERPAEDPAERIAQAHRLGLEEGRAAAAADGEVRLAQAQMGFETRLAAARAAWASLEAERLAAQIETAFQLLQDTLATSVERILRPALAEALRQRAVEMLRETLSALMSADAPAALRISGPQDLLAALAGDLAAARRPVECAPDEGLDVRMTADRTLVESRLEAWIGKLREAAHAE